MNLTPRWEDGIFDRLVSGEMAGEEPVQLRKGCRIWQLKKDVDVAMRFIGYEDQVQKFGEPDVGNYTLVFDGDLGTSDLEQIYTICRDAPPPGYQGYRMALSDVVELYDDSGILPDVQETRDNLQEMLDLLEEHYGVKPILYAAPNTYRKYISCFQGEYPIWISNYYYQPYFDWTFWQYTDSGMLQGYDGDQMHIDLNVYSGSMDEFRKQFGLAEKGDRE